ncbi:MAG: hypothetical protein IPG54_06030 [Sphingomonadales bacterium]|nr:hypothetical protein [Sphingomonadales bacterium]
MKANAGIQKAVFALSAATCALVMPTYAYAQDEAADTAEEEVEIVVTAQGRAQVLSDVPVAISAVNAETLQNSGANDIRQLNQVAPSLLVSVASVKVV